MKPTEEQKEEFWKWCGFLLRRNVAEDNWYFDGNYYGSSPPPIDLNNLFKYAVPKLDEEDKKKVFDEWLYLLDVNRDEDPALVLFWALWEVKEATK